MLTLLLFVPFGEQYKLKTSTVILHPPLFFLSLPNFMISFNSVRGNILDNL